LDAGLDHRADRITGQRYGCGHLGWQIVVVRHGGLNRGSVAVGDRLSLLDRPRERGRRLRVLLRPGLGGEIAVDGQVQNGALVQVSEHLLAVLLSRGGDVWFGEKRRTPVAVLELPGHCGEASRVGDESHLSGGDSVRGKQRADQQGADAVGSVDPEIFLPASSAMVVMGEVPAITSTRVFGARVEASARTRNLPPAACAEMYAT